MMSDLDAPAPSSDQPQQHSGFRLLLPGDQFPSVLADYVQQFESEKFGLAQVSAFKISYNKFRDIYRARIDSKMRVPSPARRQQSSSDDSVAQTMLLFQTDYIELRTIAGSVQHIGTRLDAEISSGSGLSGKVAHWEDFRSWAEWIDDL